MTPFQDMGRVDRLLSWMDDAGVEKAVMLPVVNADFAPDNNAECGAWARQHPDRLAAMTDVPLHEADAPARVRAARDTFGAVAISCYPGPGLGWLNEPAHQDLWAAFAESGLPCNLQVTPPDYGHIIEAARRHPEVTILLNHYALPKGAGIEPRDPTYGGLDAAAGLPNLCVKVSAAYAAADTPWDPACPRPLGYLARLRDLLGADRLLFGTDWPPAGRHLTYRQAVEVVRTYADLDDTERVAVLGGTAARVFGI
jgi:L-fuconolactonase